MKKIKIAFVLVAIIFLPGCSLLPITIGFIPSAPAFVASVLNNGHTVYESAVDERSTQQQLLDSIIAGHAQAEFYKHSDITPHQISAYCYFNKLYLVGEYTDQEQLRKIYECVNRVDGKKAVISRLYQKKDNPGKTSLEAKAMYTDIESQLVTDFEITSSPIEIKIIQGDIILLGVISDKAERDKIMAHALNTDGVKRVVSYLYHSENAGPEPRVMTAELAPPPARKPLLPKKHTRKKKVEKAPPVTQKLSVTNSDRGR